MDQPNIYLQIYQVVAQVPRGKVTTYGDVAWRLGRPGLARVVGNALHCNPDPEHIPCQRVVNAAGRTSKAFAFGGNDLQRAMLENEGVEFIDDHVDMSKYRW